MSLYPYPPGYNLAALSLTSVAPCGSLLTSHPCRLYPLTLLTGSANRDHVRSSGTLSALS